MRPPAANDPGVPPTELSSASVLRAVLGRVTAAALVAGMFGLIKAMGTTYPLGEVVFARCFFALVPIAIQLHVLSGWDALRTRRPAAHALRSGFGLASLFLSFAAISMLPLSTATALSYTIPLFIAVFAATTLRESIDRQRWLALAVGFGGVLLMVDPDFSSSNGLGVLLAVLSAVAGAAAVISIRSMASTESSTTIAFYFAVVGAFVGALSMLFEFVVPRWSDLPILIGIGLMGGTAQLLLTFAYHRASASVIAPWEYATLIFATLIGAIAWAHLPTMRELFGIATIIGANLLVSFRRQRRPAPG